MNHKVENLRGLWYKLRIMGLPIESPSYIYGDNMYVIYNTSRPESVLRKELNIICYNFVRESVAAFEFLASHTTTLKNLSDLLAKVLYSQKRRNLVKGVLRHIDDHEQDK